MMSYEALISIVTLVTIVLFLFVGSLRVIDGAINRSASSSRSTRSCCWRTARWSLLLDIWDELQYG